MEKEHLTDETLVCDMLFFSGNLYSKRGSFFTVLFYTVKFFGLLDGL